MRDVTAVAAACMARGLSVDEAERVWELLADLDLPVSIETAYEQLETAINAAAPWRVTE